MRRRNEASAPRQDRSAGWRRAAFGAVALAAMASAAVVRAQETTTAKDVATTQAIGAALKQIDAMQMLGAKPAAPLGDDPLKEVADRMENVHGDLKEFKTDQPVQVKEKQVVVKLDLMIKALEQQAAKSGRGQGNNQPRRQSVIASGEASIGALHDANEQGRAWGQLPPKQREQILQSRTEGFPPGYEALLQSYYQRLSQEKVNDEKAAPATQP